MIISKIRAVLLRYHIGSLLAVSFLFFSCTKDRIVSAAINEQQSNLSKAVNQNSSEDLFRSIVFLDGNFADTHLKDFAEYNIKAFTTDAKVISEAKKFESSIIEKIKLSDPQYLENFKSKISSGDYEIVKATLQDAAALVYETAKSITGNSNSDIAALTNSFLSKYSSQGIKSVQELKNKVQTSLAPPTKGAGSVTFAYDIAVALYIVIAAGVFLVAVIFLFAPDSPNGGMNNFLSEKYLSDITLSFAN